MGTAALTAAMVGVVPASSASAQPKSLAAQSAPISKANFLAYGTGSEAAVKALAIPPTTLLRVDEAFSANTAAGGPLFGGLGTAVTSPVTGALVQTDQTANGANAYGRGSGIEVGAGLTTAQANQIQLGIAEAHAAPTTPLITKTAIPLSIPGVLTTGLLTGKAAAAFSPSFCPVGQPLAYGEGDASAPTSVVGSPPPISLVSGTGASGTNAAQTRTRTDLIANADGTFGLANTVQETIAPLSINLGGLSIQITVQGDGPNSPLTVTTATDGEGHNAVSFANDDPVVKVAVISGTATLLTLPLVKASALAALINPLLGATGALGLILNPLNIRLSVDVAGKSALPGAVAGSASVAYDLIHLNASLGTTTLADVRVGHVESEVALPTGSIACTIPVAKAANPAVVTAGNTFTWTILVPATSTILSDSACDLTNIKATDTIKVNSGSPTFTVGTISNGGVYNASSGTITWSNLGTYHPGDPPIALTIQVSVPSGSPAGVLQDTANVTASLGNCTGGVTGTSTISNAVIGGSVTLVAPTINAAGANPGLAATGTGPMLPWIAAGLLLVAEATRRVLRRARNNP